MLNGQFPECLTILQKPANILVMGEGPERGKAKIGKFLKTVYDLVLTDFCISDTSRCVDSRVDLDCHCM